MEMNFKQENYSKKKVKNKKEKNLSFVKNVR